MRVHLLRHGEVENPRNVRYGRLPRFGLSARGKNEAERAAIALRGTYLSEIVTSPLERARESAEIVRALTDGPEPRVDERLTEAHEWREGLPRGLAVWPTIERALEVRSLPSVEKPWAIASRMAEVVMELVERGGASNAEVAVVTHQTPIRFVRLYFERTRGVGAAALAVRLLPRLYSRYRCTTGSITTLIFEETRFSRCEYLEPVEPVQALQR